MPSFFQFIKRMSKGEPVYQQSDSATSGPVESPKPQPLGSKIIPQAMITRSECRINNQHMNCSAEISNNSQQVIFLDEIHIFGVKHELQRELKPGEERELEIYDGPAITGRFINECYLLYRNSQGDYFKSHHDADCQQDQNGQQRLTRIRFLPPVEDV